MGWFRVSENDAIREIEKVNAGVKVIRETIRITGDEVVNSNKSRSCSSAPRVH